GRFGFVPSRTMQAIYHKPDAVDEYCRLRYSCAPSVTVSNLLRKLTRVKNDRQSLASLACTAAGKEWHANSLSSSPLFWPFSPPRPISATLKVAATASMVAGSGFAVAGSGSVAAAGAGEAVAGVSAGDGAGMAGWMVGLGSRLGLGRRLGLGPRVGFSPRVGLGLALEPPCSPPYQHKVPKQRGVNTNGRSCGNHLPVRGKSGGGSPEAARYAEGVSDRAERCGYRGQATQWPCQAQSAVQPNRVRRRLRNLLGRADRYDLPDAAGRCRHRCGLRCPRRQALRCRHQ